MTRQEQRKFVKEVIDSVSKDIVEKLPKVPEEWDGRELRQFVADNFALATWALKEDKTRYRDYKNEVVVRDLV